MFYVSHALQPTLGMCNPSTTPSTYPPRIIDGQGRGQRIKLYGFTYLTINGIINFTYTATILIKCKFGPEISKVRGQTHSESEAQTHNQTRSQTHNQTETLTQ
ncbi:unnamed protein product, partial [Nesidiocoris tenuis]